MASAMTSISDYDSSPFMIAISREMSDDPHIFCRCHLPGHINGKKDC